MSRRTATRSAKKRNAVTNPAPVITQLRPQPGTSPARLGLRKLSRPKPPERPSTYVATADDTDNLTATTAVTPRSHDGPRHEPVTRRRRHWLKALRVLTLILVVAALARTTGGAASAPAPASPTSSEPRTYTLRGYLSITAPAPSVLISTTQTVGSTDDAACWGQSQYSDIQEGTVVTVYDDHDTEVASGFLEAGRTSRLALPTTAMPVCWFPFRVVDLPANAAYFQVKIGQRGTIQVANTPQDGVLRAFPSLNPADGPAPQAPGNAGVEQGLDPQVPTVLPAAGGDDE